jgi:rhamnosyltransferase
VARQDVCALIVAYYPDHAALAYLAENMSAQSGAVVVVDNTGLDSEARVPDGLWGVRAVLRQPVNIGLAAAQNRGIEWIRAHDFNYVLLLDQDSMPHEGMVDSLVTVLEQVQRDMQVAAVGPQFHDLREPRGAPFIRLGFPFNRKIYCAGAKGVIKSNFLISSGMLVPLHVIDHVGEMNEGLFIDNVDLEWGFRAQSMGYGLYGVCAAVMQHRLGESRHELPFEMGRVVVHGPVRLYYIMRNRVLLYGMAHTPRIWIAQDVLRIIIKFFLFSVLIGPRLRNIRAMVRGLCDGLRGRTGAYPD